MRGVRYFFSHVVRTGSRWNARSPQIFAAQCIFLVFVVSQESRLFWLGFNNLKFIFELLHILSIAVPKSRRRAPHASYLDQPSVPNQQSWSLALPELLATEVVPPFLDHKIWYICGPSGDFCRKSGHVFIQTSTRSRSERHSEFRSWQVIRPAG